MRIEQPVATSEPKYPAAARRRTISQTKAKKAVSAVTNPENEQANETVKPVACKPARKRQAIAHEKPIHVVLNAFTNPVDDGADQAMDSTTPMGLLPDPQLIPGHFDDDAQNVVAGKDTSDDGAHTGCESQPESSPVIARIQQLWRMRQRWVRAQTSLTLQGKAVCRSWTNGDKDEANALFDAVSKGADDADPVLRMALEPFLRGIEQFEPLRKAIEKELKSLATQLPVWPWVKDVKGFGPMNFAGLVGECGDIGSYRNPSCVWKRMGLAVIGGERQRKKSDAEEALAHGYNPSRRAVAYLLGDTLIKGNGEGPYRAIYLKRKDYEIARTDEGKPTGPGPGHAHNRAARYMVKRVLKDLWQAWRQASSGPQPIPIVSDAEPFHQDR